MHDQRVGARIDHRIRQRIERELRILVIDPDAAFHRDGNAHRALHRRDAGGDELRLRHQAGAEAAILDPVGRTADIEIDFVITEVFADPRRGREIGRIGPAKLQRHRMLARIEAEQPLPIAMNDGAGGDHLGIEQRPPRQQAVKHPAVPVGPIHHRRHGKAPTH